jgi:hypothetical protein
MASTSWSVSGAALKRASAKISACAPPSPTPTSGPKTGSLVTPTSISTPALTIG